MLRFRQLLPWKQRSYVSGSSCQPFQHASPPASSFSSKPAVLRALGEFLRLIVPSGWPKALCRKGHDLEKQSRDRQKVQKPWDLCPEIPKPRPGDPEPGTPRELGGSWDLVSTTYSWAYNPTHYSHNWVEQGYKPSYKLLSPTSLQEGAEPRPARTSSKHQARRPMAFAILRPRYALDSLNELMAHISFMTLKGDSGLQVLGHFVAPRYYKEEGLAFRSGLKLYRDASCC